MKKKTIITDDSFSYYSKELSNLKQMTPKREKEIAKLMMSGTLSESEKKKLEDEIVTGYLRYVISEALTLQYTGVDTVDLIQEGNYGLMKAIKDFKWSKGLKFTTYAYQWIRACMFKSIYDHARIIRLPLNVAQELHKQIKEFNETGKEMEGKYVNLPNTTDLFRSINNDDEDSTLVDVVKNPNADNFEKMISNKDMIEKMMDKLTDKEQKVINKYFGLEGFDYELKEIAEDMKMNVESIRLIKNRALNKMAI